jgi:hypothetical protein
MEGRVREIYQLRSTGTSGSGTRYRRTGRVYYSYHNEYYLGKIEPPLLTRSVAIGEEDHTV